MTTSAGGLLIRDNHLVYLHGCIQTTLPLSEDTPAPGVPERFYALQVTGLTGDSDMGIMCLGLIVRQMALSAVHDLLVTMFE